MVIGDRFLKTLSVVQAMETDDENKPSPGLKLRAGRNANTPLLPEVDAYIHLLVLLALIDKGKNTEARECAGEFIKIIADVFVICNCFIVKFHSVCPRLSSGWA